MADDEHMEAVALEEKKESPAMQKEEQETNVHHVEQRQEQQQHDPFALPEDGNGELVQNNEKTDDEEPLTDTQKALESLRRSSVRLGSVIDGKVGITKAVGDIDSKVHASQTLKSATAALGGWLSAVDTQLGVSQKTLDLGNSISESALVAEKIKPTVMESTRTLQAFDEVHGITASTASTLARGVDMLTQSIVGDGSDANAPSPHDGNDDGPPSGDGFLG